jgi:hypothetical protein
MKEAKAEYGKIVAFLKRTWKLLKTKKWNDFHLQNNPLLKDLVILANPTWEDLIHSE